MAQRIDTLRRQERRHNLRPLGLNGDQVRLFAGQAQTAGLEAAILALPFRAGDEQPLQDAVTGALFFMVGVSEVGGPDGVG
jgi:hypothetical protein